MPQATFPNPGPDDAEPGGFVHPIHLRIIEEATRYLTPLIPVARGPCDHTQAQVGYHPTRTLVHLVCARNATCTAPGSAGPRPAATWTTRPRGIRAV